MPSQPSPRVQPFTEVRSSLTWHPRYSCAQRLLNADWNAGGAQSQQIRLHARVSFSLSHFEGDSRLTAFLHSTFEALAELDRDMNQGFSRGQVVVVDPPPKVHPLVDCLSDGNCPATRLAVEHWTTAW